MPIFDYGSSLKFSRNTTQAMGALAISWLAILAAAANSFAQPPDSYGIYSSADPPGVIGQRQLKHGRVPPGLIQPVRVIAPAGALVAPASSGSFYDEHYAPAEFGLQVGEIYRFKLTDIPRMDGVSLYPSVEIIGYLSPPEGKARDFPVPLVFTFEDLNIAAQGGLVTRVVYVEDPDLAVPGTLEEDDQAYFEVARGEDPLQAAEVLGRPVAIVRIGSKTPAADGPSDTFTYGSPALEKYSGARRALPKKVTRNLRQKPRPSAVQQVSHSASPLPKPAKPVARKSPRLRVLAPVRRRKRTNNVETATLDCRCLSHPLPKCSLKDRVNGPSLEETIEWQPNGVPEIGAVFDFRFQPVFLRVSCDHRFNPAHLGNSSARRVD